MDNDMLKTIVAKNGTYIGKQETKTDVYSFLGIPFARAERWQRASDVTTTSDNKIMACEYGKVPWQEIREKEYPVPVPLSEDCLNLNLYGKNLNQVGKAVMVWIYGGAQVAGNNIGIGTASGEALFDGRKIVEQNPDLLLVIPNYRVGFWGSVNLSVLEGYTDQYDASNNLARLDILHCLKWIQDNIIAFGGSPEKVTLFGQSAGSANITSLLLMPEAKGLFKRVICESSFAMDISLTTWKDSMTISRELFNRLHVDNIEDALQLKPETLLTMQAEIVKNSMGGSPAFAGMVSKLFSPVIDGMVIPNDYWEYLLHIGCAGIDFLGGTNEGEYDQQFESYKSPKDWTKAKNMVLDHCKGKVNPQYGGKSGVVSAYLQHQEPNRTEFEAIKDLKNDLYLRMNALSYSMIFAREGASSYLYYLTLKQKRIHDEIRCPHGAEIPILFIKDSTAETEIQEQIRSYWYNFARTGSPNDINCNSFWSQVGLQTLDTMVIGENCKMVSGIRIKNAELLLPLMNEYKNIPEFAEICDAYFKFG